MSPADLCPGLGPVGIDKHVIRGHLGHVAFPGVGALNEAVFVGGQGAGVRSVREHQPLGLGLFYFDAN